MLESGIIKYGDEFMKSMEEGGWDLSKVDKNYTSQICPNFGTKTGKKELPQRIHKMWARN